jgi:CheY-like chemotaxis protein
MPSPGPILIVEDNEDDLYFARRAFAKVAPAEQLCCATDGQAALDYLRGAGAYGDRALHPFPRLMFLDLKLPFVHGLEVLAAIRADPALRDLPVIILTSSSEERDRGRAQALGIQGYLVKPAAPADLMQALAQPRADCVAATSAS